MESLSSWPDHCKALPNIFWNGPSRRVPAVNLELYSKFVRESSFYPDNNPFNFLEGASFPQDVCRVPPYTLVVSRNEGRESCFSRGGSQRDAQTEHSPGAGAKYTGEYLIL